MKRIFIISFVILTCFIIILNLKNDKKYIEKDGVMLALTLDGERINKIPESNNYYVHVQCTNGVGKWLAEEWKLSVEEINGNVICNIDFISTPNTLINEVENKTLVNINGYRYNGKNPNNYIWFNNEIWRIIGSVPVCLEASCGESGTNLVKLIRNDSLGKLVINTNSDSRWSDSHLYTVLNSYYYGKSSGTCYSYESTATGFCDYSQLGIVPNGYYGKMVKNVYWNTGKSSNSTAFRGFYQNEIQTQSVLGYIGLMNISDLTLANEVENTTNLDNWLYRYSNEKNLTIYTDAQWCVCANYAGELSVCDGDFGGHVRPVVYLDPSVYIISGDGTSNNPYQIGM